VSHRIRALAGSVLAASLIAAAPAAAAPQPANSTVTAHAARACHATNVLPNRHNLRKVRAAVLCLVNAQRASAGLPRLHADGKLAKAARKHSRDMVHHHYFSHVTPSGRTGGSRISAAHYRWSAWGENIAWGSGSLATPAQIVQGWMNSPGHRANILNGNFRQSGIGVSVGTPTGAGGATYTHDFGRR
jgi:uncharacterized protein YkwD